MCESWHINGSFEICLYWQMLLYYNDYITSAKAEYKIGILCCLCKLDVVFLHFIDVDYDKWSVECRQSAGSWVAGGLSFQQCDSRSSIPYSTEHPFLQLPHTGRTFVRVELSCVPATAPIHRRASETSVSTGRQLDASRLSLQAFILNVGLITTWDVTQ